MVCVGIDAHFSKKVPDLNQAVKDAKDVAGALESKYGYKPKLLLNRDATKTAILAALDELDARSPPPEAVVLYFAGHGITFEYAPPNDPVPTRVGYLVPYDADVDLKDTSSPERWAEEAIGMRWLVDRIETMKAGHVVLIADACCSGYLTKRGGVAETPEFVQLLSDPSRKVLAATTQRESAQEGVFTPELLKILGAVDADPLSVTDVFLKLRTAVSKNPNGAKMTPQMSHAGAGDGEFVFVPTRVNKEEVAALAGLVEEYRRTKKVSAAGALVSFRGIGERQQKRQGRQSRLSDVAAALEAEDYRYSASAEAEATRWEGIRRTFAENASLGDTWAMAGLHFCYAKGLGGDVSAKDAYFWARQAGQFAKPPGLGDYLLARCYELGLGVAKNEVAARRLYDDSAAKGFALGQVAQAQKLVDGKPDDDARKQARELLETARKQGVSRAAFLLARLDLDAPGDGKPDLTAAKNLLLEAAQGGVVEADLFLYRLHGGQGRFAPLKDLDVAGRHLTRAAERGHARSQSELATELYGKEPYEPVLKLPANVEAAHSWATLAAKQSDPAAHVLLSYLSQRGDFVEVDLKAAEDHFKRAADMKFPPALNQYAYCLTDGTFRRDAAQAHELLKQSAEAGDADGRAQLGDFIQARIDPVTGKYLDRDHALAGKFHRQSHHTFHYYYLAVRDSDHHVARKALQNLQRYVVTEPKWARYSGLRNGAVYVTELMAQLREDHPESAKGIAELFAKFAEERLQAFLPVMKKAAEDKVHEVPADGLKLQGETTANAPRDPEQSTPAQAFGVRLDAGKTYSFVMESESPDYRSIYLRLLDEKGKEVAGKGDYNGTGRSAIISFTPRDSGRYFLVATSFNVPWGKPVGRFTLKVERDK